MGMSASQARYIALTARMNDTEYEAQQVNQQRLTLANKMNEVYEALCNMEVPTPPSKIDYAIENYSGNLLGSKVSVRRNSAGKFVAFQETTGAVTKRTAGTKGEAVTKKYSPVSDLKGTISYPDLQEKDGVYYTKDSDDAYTVEVSEEDKAQYAKETYTAEQLKNYSVVENGMVRPFDASKDLNEDGTLKIATENIVKEDSKNGTAYATTSSEGGNRITSVDGKLGTVGEIPAERSDVVNQALDALKHSNPNYSEAELMDKFYLVTYDDGSFAFTLKEDYDQKDSEVAIFEITNGKYDEEMEEGSYEIKFSTNGGIESISNKSGDTAILESEQKFNEVEYEEANAKYKYEKTVYDHDQNVLNKQTSIYQRQDKQLELKLTRLDSERNALNTELEAVKKVIQDAIDKGFKTFSG